MVAAIGIAGVVQQETIVRVQILDEVLEVLVDLVVVDGERDARRRRRRRRRGAAI